MNKTYRITDNTEYVVEEDLTQGAPGKKYRTCTASTADDHTTVVIKEMDETRAQIYTLLAGIQNRHIAHIHGVYRIDDPAGNEPFYIAVTECVGHCDEKNREPSLTEYVNRYGPLDKMTALGFALQICDAMKAIHRKNIIHRDLKPDNIMVSDEMDGDLPCLKLIDFGISNVGEDPNEITRIRTHIEYAGTACYCPYDKRLTPKWDIYSLGIVLNFMLTGHTPDMHIYNDDPEIRNIIEQCIDEYSLRYRSSDSLYREINHSARTGLWDRIPILRSVPGYRSHTLWKSIIATLCYALLVYLGIDIIAHRGIDSTFAVFVLSWFLLPVMIVFDPLYLRYRIKPLRALRHNGRLFIILQAAALFFSLFVLPNILLWFLVSVTE